jgi:hypothetical protein
MCVCNPFTQSLERAFGLVAAIPSMHGGYRSFPSAFGIILEFASLLVRSFNQHPLTYPISVAPTRFEDGNGDVLEDHNKWTTVATRKERCNIRKYLAWFDLYCWI